MCFTEKDVNSCTLDAKNESSWTSWAMTSLSSKLSDYKNKGQQPSIALTTTSEAKKLAETSTISPKAATEIKQQSSPNFKSQQANSATKSTPFTDAKSFAQPSQMPKLAEGWDENEWKELDDNEEDEMEPLEEYFGSNTKTEPKSSKTPTTNWDSNLTAASTKSSCQPSNWSQPTTSYSNEEEMFTTLVKDVSYQHKMNQYFQNYVNSSLT
jgi:hypothetical protein